MLLQPAKRIHRRAKRGRVEAFQGSARHVDWQSRRHRQSWFGGLHLQMKMNRDTFTFDLAIDLKKSEEAKAMRIHKGDIIRFIGILNTWGSLLPISVDDGEIISQ